MTHLPQAEPTIVTAAEAEELASIGHYLLADGSDTGGALSSHRVRLARGAAGAVPHRHDRSTEVFFVIDGALEVLVGSRVTTAHPGDLLVVPPRLPHAFAAAAASGVDVLILITPGIDRFEYLRQVARIRSGTVDPASLLGEQERYDTHFLDSAEWAHRPGA